jgi:hypothetical protein
MSRRLLVVALLVLCASAALARERAVMIYPRERVLFRRVFYTAHQDALIARVGETYDVTVHEDVATDDELFAIDVDGAELLVLSGHGDPFAMYFAGRKERTLDATDRERLKAFFDRLTPDATIMLQSCYTGRGFAHMVKEAAGPNRTVIAARGVVPRDGVEITSVAPFDATIHCGVGGEQRWDCTLRLQ